jgi:hypothetical protein
VLKADFIVSVSLDDEWRDAGEFQALLNCAFAVAEAGGDVRNG